MASARPIPTVTASGGAGWEPGLLARLSASPDVRIVRRCVDLVDLMATAGSGTARAALVGAGLHRLDRDGIARLTGAGVAVVGVATPNDSIGRNRLLALGVTVVLAADASTDTIGAAVVHAVDDLDPRTRVSTTASPPRDERVAFERPPALTEPGRLIAVWGPTGAPGRTTLAVNLAAELAAAGLETLLADADTFGASVAQVLGLLDESPGLAAAVRSASQGVLDADALAHHARQVSPRLRVLTGLPRANRWAELRPAALANVWEVARETVGVVVVDCGFSLEQEDDMAFDVAAPRRNAATLTTLEHADLVVAVGLADPVGLQRLVRGLHELREAIPVNALRVVVNRARRGVVGTESSRAPLRALRRHASVEDALLLPDNAAAVDAALMAGRPLLEVTPRAPLRVGIRELTEDIAAGIRPAPVLTGRARHRAKVPVPR